MNLQNYLESQQKSGKFNLAELLQISQKDEKTAFVTLLDDPNSPEAGEIHEYVKRHDLLPPNYQKISGEEIEQQGARLFEPTTPLAEKRKILMLLAHLGVYESYNILKKYAENPDPELSVWTRMALEECQVFVKQNLSDDLIHSVTVIARTGRNEPCPCGSGKKFKKCCGKS